MKERIERLQENLPAHLDGVIITSDVNRRYYLGMASTAGTLLVTRKEAVLLIDFRYYEEAARTVTGCRVVRQEKVLDQLNQIIREEKLAALGLESGYMTLAEACRLRDGLSCQVDFGGEMNGIILRQRAVKSPWERERIAQAQAISDKAFLRMLEIIKPGMTEREIATQLEITCLRLGSEDKSFDPIVVAGPNSSSPHGHPGFRPVQKGDFPHHGLWGGGGRLPRRHDPDHRHRPAHQRDGGGLPDRAGGQGGGYRRHPAGYSRGPGGPGGPPADCRPGLWGLLRPRAWPWGGPGDP